MKVKKRKKSKREKHIRKLIINHIGINDDYFPLGWIGFSRRDALGDHMSRLYIDTKKLARRIELYLRRR